MNTCLPRSAYVLSVILGIALATPGCFTVGDDDSGDAGQSGETGESGKGGTSSGNGGSGGSDGGTSSGNGGSGGTGGSTGGSGGMCFDAGDACGSNGECCSFSDPVMGYCVGGICADGCTVDADCQSHCCAGLQSGGTACGPAEICCVDDYQPCEVNNDCCSYLTGEGYCISDTGACQPVCTTGDDCDSGCCLPIDAETGESVCAPAEYCAPSAPEG